MHALLRNILVYFTLAIAFVGCSTLAPESSIHINGDPIVSWNDVREIERLLPSLGIKYPITEITPKGPDRAEIVCTIRPSYEGNPTEEVESFTVVRRGGHWIAVGRPRKLRLVVTS
jgi:hypothetical protein